MITLLFVFTYNLRVCGRPIWRTVTICHRIPFKPRFINTSSAILMYFVNTTLKFSAIIDGKLYCLFTRRMSGI